MPTPIVRTMLPASSGQQLCVEGNTLVLDEPIQQAARQSVSRGGNPAHRGWAGPLNF